MQFLKNTLVSFIAVIVLFPFAATATFPTAGQYYVGATGEKATRSEVLTQVRSGQVVIVSEMHGHEPHHQNQRDFLVEVSGASFPISVGMEFIDFTHQEKIDAYGNEKLDEPDFLKQIGWGGNPFDNYRFQVRLPYYRGGKTLGLNMPRSITGQVAKTGLDSLSPEQKAMLPPEFELGQESLFKRFESVMKEHIPAKSMKNYFAAHSIWDDTMAWKAAEHMQKNPDSLLVIIVGDFHVAYMDGLVARLHKRGVKDVLAISQVDTTEMTADERKKTLQPDEEYGVRANFIFDVYEEK